MSNMTDMADMTDMARMVTGTEDSETTSMNGNASQGTCGGISLDNLSVGYNGKALIDDIELQVRPGHIVTLIGPNGAGKSTILKSIIRELKPINGVVYLSGRNSSELKSDEVAKELSLVMTERPRAELMTCREVVATGRYPYTGRLGILSEEDWQKVDDAIKLVGVNDTADKDFECISDGQRQRVMLAKAICQEPKILILDEPTSFLDIRFKLDILSTIHRLAREKKIAVIMSLHELELAKGISDIIACVEGNHIGKIGSPDEIFTGGYIQRLYGIDEESFDEKTGMIILPEWEDNFLE